MTAIRVPLFRWPWQPAPAPAYQPIWSGEQGWLPGPSTPGPSSGTAHAVPMSASPPPAAPGAGDIVLPVAGGPWAAVILGVIAVVAYDQFFRR